MSPTPFVSVRKWIQWEGQPADEDTDTQVLTTASKYFIDTRIFLSIAPCLRSLAHERTLPNTKLEWAFAGTATSTPAIHNKETGKLEKPAHTVWTHWIDDHTVEEVKDEGYMFPDEGVDGEVIEKGRMRNPATGEVEEYVECWIDLDPLVVDGENGFKSWTLKAEGGKEGSVVRGMMVRIADYAQAIVRNGDSVGIKRWKWEGVSWKEASATGVCEAPLGVEGLGGEVKLDDELTSSDGLVWKCVETFHWT